MHAIRVPRLVDWIDDELWHVELGDEVEEEENMLVARRGRLLGRVAGWDGDAARAFGEACIWRTRDLAREVLGRAGLERDRDALADVGEVDQLQELAVAQARDATGAAADALVYLADTVQVSRGGWFETYEGHPSAGAPATPGATAANLGFVAAVAAGGAAADAGGPEAFEDGYDAERARQLEWLTERLGLG